MAHSEVQNFSERLRHQREKLGIRKHELAANIGVSLTTIQQYENGQMPRGEFAVRLANELHCSLDWLLAGRNTEAFTQIASQEFVNIPIVEANFESDTNGFTLSPKEQGHYIFYSDFLYTKGNPATMVLLQVMGDSMQPSILNNDLVLIDQDQTKLMPGQMYAIGIENMVYVKLVNTIPGKLLLSSINTAYATIEVDINKQNSLNIIGRVVWLSRNVY